MWVFRMLFGIFLVVVFTIVLEHAGWSKGFERAAFDAWLRARLHLDPVSESDQIVIVGITDQDYEDTFEAKSPLDEKALEEILQAILSAKPAVIGVDLDTSSEQFKAMKLTSEIPIVWAEDALFNEEKPGEPTVFRALAGTQSEPLLTGIASLPIDNDGIVRSYTRKIGRHDSFSWALTRTYCRRVKEAAAAGASPPLPIDLKTTKRCETVALTNENEKQEDFTLNLLGGRSRFHSISIREVLDDYKAGRQDVLKRMSGRMVLLGGLFHVARDEYTTPLGRMAGVQLMAHAVESELQGGGFRWPREPFMLLLNIVGGIGILILFIRFTLVKGCLLSMALIAIVAPLWSWVAFGSMIYFGYFAVILSALLIHQLYEQALYSQHVKLHQLSGHNPEHAVLPEQQEDKSPPAR